MSGVPSNHWHDIALLKLDPCPSSEGPFLVVQEVADATAPEQGTRVWILRTDGFWAVLSDQFSQAEDEKFPLWFDSIAEVIELLARLPEAPRICSRELMTDESPVSKIAHLNIEGIQERVAAWKKSREQQRA